MATVIAQIPKKCWRGILCGSQLNHILSHDFGENEIDSKIGPNWKTIADQRLIIDELDESMMGIK